MKNEIARLRIASAIERTPRAAAKSQTFIASRHPAPHGFMKWPTASEEFIAMLSRMGGGGYGAREDLKSYEPIEPESESDFDTDTTVAE